MNVYLWAELLHLLFLISWMATVFSLPFLLLNLADPRTDSAARAQLAELGRRCYRVGHHLFGWAFVFGLVLWLYVGIGGAWLHVKLVVVVLLAAHLTLGGRWLKGVERGRSLPSVRVLRG